MVEEAKTEVVEKSESELVNEKMDEKLDELEQETPGETSTPKQTTGDEVKKTETSEDTTSKKSVEVKEETTEAPEGFHKHPAWQRIMQERDDARAKLGESTKSAMSEDDRKLLDDVRGVVNTPEYIQTSMKAKGFTQEAINKTLGERGFDVPAKPEDDLQIVAKELNLNLDSLGENEKATISDVASVARIIVKNMLDKVLPNQLKPLEEHLTSFKQQTEGDKMISKMEKLVTDEGVLNFKEDIEPIINKFLDEKPDANQRELLEHFKDSYHSLSIERLKTGKKVVNREAKKGNLRQNAGAGSAPSGAPAKTGDFDKDFDAMADHLGMANE